MPLPTLEQYNEAAQNPAYAFIDPELKTGTVKTSGLGTPLAACGGFALTYTITCNNKKYAVRCFHKEVKDRDLRYQVITSKLASLNSPYFVDFEYQRRGIRIKNQDFPIVKMAWAQGQTIGEFIDANLKKKDFLLDLKQSLLNLSRYLGQNHIAHGDIQPGNLMVADGGRAVQLIDYDGIYLPELANLDSAEIGHINFSHPDRKSLNPWNERSDYFPFIMLDIVLDALAISPDLWRDTHSDGDKFIFSANDFVSPATSQTFTLLAALPGFKDKISRFSSICNGAYDDIPSVDDFLNIAIEIQSDEPLGEERSFGYISAYPVLDAKDYDACLAHVGDVVELVGKVENVKSGKTPYGSPYYFINFSNWRGKAVKISVWSDYLKRAQDTDFELFEGEYISVTGLMQPPYENYKYGYSHLSISLDSTITPLTYKEFKYRLNYEKDPVRKVRTPKNKSSQKKRSNRQIFTNIKNDGKGNATSQFSAGNQRTRSMNGSGTTAQSASGARKRSNRDIFNDIKNAASRTGATNQTSASQSGGFAFIINCPKCNGENYVSINYKTDIVCAFCHEIYNFDPASNPGRRVNMAGTGNAAMVVCPHCAREVFVNVNVKSDITCPFCSKLFTYDPATGKTTPLFATWVESVQPEKTGSRQEKSLFRRFLDFIGFIFLLMLPGIF